MTLIYRGTNTLMYWETNMLRKARKVLPRDACLTLFNAMVLPLFDYCCVVWDSCGQGNKNFLDRLYRRAASIIEDRKVTQDELGTVFKWRSLQRRRDYHKCLQVYKCLNGLAPTYLLDNFEKFNQIHSMIPARKTSSAAASKNDKISNCV